MKSVRTVACVAFLAPALLSVRAQDLEGLKIEKDEKGSYGLESYTFTYRLGKGEDSIRGILLKPAGSGPFPAVVVNHGRGGNAEGFSRGFGSVFVEKGYVVIACDLTHAGREGGDRSTFAGSKENVERILASLRILESLPYVDKKKLCMYGNSMGAFATVAACTQTDKVKAAAITAGGIRAGRGQDTEENVPRITAPFLILHGSEDRVVRLELAKDFRAALDKSGKTSELKIFEGGGHGIAREKRDEVFTLILAFFDRHVR